jgi:predicted MFS family arabinose efflux permease
VVTKVYANCFAKSLDMSKVMNLAAGGLTTAGSYYILSSMSAMEYIGTLLEKVGYYDMHGINAILATMGVSGIAGSAMYGYVSGLRRR